MFLIPRVHTTQRPFSETVNHHNQIWLGRQLLIRIAYNDNHHEPYHPHRRLLSLLTTNGYYAPLPPWSSLRKSPGSGTSSLSSHFGSQVKPPIHQDSYSDKLCLAAATPILKHRSSTYRLGGEMNSRQASAVTPLHPLSEEAQLLPLERNNALKGWRWENVQWSE